MLARVLAAALAMGLIAPSAHAAFPGTNGMLAFESSRTSDPEIWSSNPDGTRPVRLTTAPGADNDAAWSPDGTRIAFTSNRDGNPEIYSMNADGSDQRRLTSDPAQDRDPTWSPDGTRIAFTSDRGGSADIWAMAADGTGPVQLTSAPDPEQQAAWSPDGSRIAYGLFGAPAGGIFTVPASGGAPSRLTMEPSDADPAWAPDGARLAIERRGGISTIASDGSGDTTVTGFGQDPNWSPDGAQIVYWSGDTIFTGPASGGGEPRPDAGQAHDPDWGRLPAPTTPPDAGETAAADKLSGSVTVRLPGAREAVQLAAAAAEIPIGSVIDASDGRMKLTTAAGTGGATQSGTFFDGVFRVSQPRSGATTDLTLTGGTFRGCGAVAAAQRRRRVRRLWANTKGRYRTNGKYSAATTRGTYWLTEDRCDGTLTRVREGSVSVRDFARRRTVTVRRGGSYLARRRR